MKAVELVHRRIIYSEAAFAELVLWQLPAPLAGSSHSYKYRLAYVVRGVCVLRYDNGSGKGDHRHVVRRQFAYVFEGVEVLIADFQSDLERINRENRDA